jgi:small subunit ribosomal protein S16
MVKIRLRRVGSKKKPTYRVVIADARAPRDGRFVEILGYYNPRTTPATFNVQEDRTQYWLSVGAQPTETVQRLLKNAGMWDQFVQSKTAVAAN